MSSLILFSAFLGLIGAKYTVDEVQQEYKRIFQIEIGEHPEFGPYMNTGPNKLDREHFLHDFVEDNYWLIHYLQANRTKEDYGKLHDLRDSPVALAEHYHRVLVEDESFNASLLTLVGRYLSSRGMELIGHSNAARETITADQLTRTRGSVLFPDRDHRGRQD